MHQAWWLGLTPEGRVEYMFERLETFRQVRLRVIGDRHPDASEAEVYAFWVGETYEDDLDPEFLKVAQEHIRSQGRSSS